MKTKLSITLTALLMLICVGATAQSVNGNNGKAAVNNVDGIATAIMNGSYQSASDLNGDNKVNAADIVHFVNMTPVNIKIKNSTSTTISLSPRVKFVLKNNRTEAVWFGAMGSVISINSNETKEYNNILIPNSKKMIGQAFANSSELEELSSNVVLYDTPANGWNSTTIIPEKINSSVTFVAGGTYEIIIGSNSSSNPEPVNPPQPSTQNVTTTVTIVNNSGAAKTFDGKICFVTYGSHPTENYTGHFKWVGTCNGSDFTIANGGQKTYTVTFAKDNSQTPTIGLNQPFASTAQLPAGYSTNNGLYINNNYTSCANYSTSTTFTQGGQYTMTIPSSGSTSTDTPTQPTTQNVTTTVTIVNNSGVAKTFDGKVCFITYGKHPNENYTGYFRFKGTCAAGSNLTIPAGGSRTYTITFAKDNSQTPSVGLGHTFATQAQRAQFQSNNGYYIGGSCYTCTDFSANDTFKNGGTYTMTIPANTHEWTSTSTVTPVNPTPTNGSVTTTVTIVNNSGVAKTFDGKVCFITYGKHPNENYTGYFRFKGTCSGASLTIPAGGRQTYTVTFAKDNNQTPSVGLGHTFATQAQRGQFRSNNGYYIGGSCYTCTDFSTNDTFRNGGTYTMTIPANTHEWSSN